jgi:hypothetical protein
MKGFDALLGESERTERCIIALRQRSIGFLGRDGEALRAQRHAVEPGGVIDQRGVAPGDDVLDDRAHRLVDVFRDLPLSGEQAIEGAREIR